MFRSNVSVAGAILPVIRPFAFFAGFVALSGIFGCSGSSGVGGMDASQLGPEWAIQLMSTCPDTPTESCVGGYPYSVGSDGLFRVGPGPQGQIFTGKLSGEELAELQKLYAESAASAQAHSGDAVCAQSIVDAGTVNEEISFVARGGATTQWVRTSERDMCSHLQSNETSQKLLAYMHDSASRRYPLPFPDDNCDTARANLESIYGKVRECKTDADCAFIDDAFQPIAQDYLTFLLKGDCSGAQPLVVANRAKVAEKRGNLLQVYSHTQEACNNRSVTSCRGFSDFQPTRPAPICGGGICRARSG
jgi:hypothetical protein